MGSCTTTPKLKNCQIKIKSNTKGNNSFIETTPLTDNCEIEPNNINSNSLETNNNNNNNNHNHIHNNKDKANQHHNDNEIRITKLNFELPADKEVFLCPIYIPKNTNIIIKINGKWSFHQNGYCFNCEGDPKEQYRNNNYGRLMGKVTGGSPFAFISENFSFTSTISGQLTLYANGDMVSVVPYGVMRIQLEGGCVSMEQNEIDKVIGWEQLVDLVIENEKMFGIKATNNNNHSNNSISGVNVNLHDEELNVVTFINKVRTNPKLFAQLYIDTTDNEYNELYHMLCEYTPVGVVNIKHNLCNAAKEHCVDICKAQTTGHISSDMKSMPGDRIRKYIGNSNNNNNNIYFGECLCFGLKKGFSIVIEMLLGRNVKVKHNRLNILNEQFNEIGVCIRNHGSYQWGCVVVFGKDLEQHN